MTFPKPKRASSTEICRVKILVKRKRSSSLKYDIAVRDLREIEKLGIIQTCRERKS